MNHPTARARPAGTLRVRFSFAAVVLAFCASGINAQYFVSAFESAANKRLKKVYDLNLDKACPASTDLSAARILKDYGAIFVADDSVKPPPKCIFENEAQVKEFHNGLDTKTMIIGGTRITLQRAAMDALIEARKEARAAGLNISPRGGSRASARTFTATLTLWNSRFHPGLEHWTRRGKISRAEALEARNASIPDQISTVLEWEKNGIYFARGFAKSILYSVAAPGSSQHISMLALDVSQFGNRRVREILAEHGWYQTVNSDVPHFTYLGHSESELPMKGLKPVTSSSYTFWIPDFEKKAFIKRISKAN